MARPVYKKAALNQRERVSLVAELLLEGALRVMGSAGVKTKSTKSKRARLRSVAEENANDCSARTPTDLI